MNMFLLMSLSNEFNESCKLGDPGKSSDFSYIGDSGESRDSGEYGKFGDLDEYGDSG